MPTVDVPISLLWQSVGRQLPAAELVSALERLGCDVEGETELAVHCCPECGESLELRVSEVPPKDCPFCGREPAGSGGWSTRSGASAIRVDLLPVRPDLFDPGGMGRALRSFLGLQDHPVEYRAAPPSVEVVVEPSVGDPSSYRPWIGCVVVRHVTFNEETLRAIMNLQESIHWGVGRDRRLASLGVYDLANIRDTVTYCTRSPDAVVFAPLSWEVPVDASHIVTDHPKGRTFGHLLEGMERYPLLVDSTGQILSMPPIINGNSTRVSLSTTELFVDATGTGARAVEFALQVFATSLQELLPGSALEAVTIREPDGTARVTPELGRRAFRLDPSLPARLLGAPIHGEEVAMHLRRMGHVTKAGGDSLVVEVPPFRNDIMHPQDLVEDVAISYGYEKIVPHVLPTDLIAEPSRTEELSRIAHEVFRGLGFLEVMTGSLMSRRRAFGMLRREPHPQAVLVENPATEEQEVLRSSLIPGLLGLLAASVGRELPQRVYEVGDVTLLDSSAETGAREARRAAVAVLGPKVGFADIRSVALAVFREYGQEPDIQPCAESSLLEGRSASLKARGTERDIGVMGELHPEVLENFHLHHPAAVLEVDLEALFPRSA